MDVDQLIEYLLRHGLEALGRFYGVYRANVMRNDDPQERGRVQLLCASVGHTKTEYPDSWVEPAMNGAGADRGSFNVPEVGDSVRVSFAFGDPKRPEVYFGGWYGYDRNKSKAETPLEFKYSNKKPQRQGMVSRMGHVFQMVDEPGKEAVRLVWHKSDPGDKALTNEALSADRTKGKFGMLSFEANGDITMANQNGSLMHFDAVNKQIKLIDENGTSVKMSSSGVDVIAADGTVLSIGGGTVTVIGKQGLTVTGAVLNAKTGGVLLGDGADSPAVRGVDLMQWLAVHTHPTAGPGVPTLPPTPSPPPTILSTKVLLR